MNKSLSEAVETVFKITSTNKIKAEIVAVESEASSISFENKELEEFSTGKSLGLGVRLIKDNKECFFSTESTKPEDIALLCEQQMEAIDYSKENEFICLTKAEEQDFRELDIFSEEAPTTQEVIDRVKDLDSALWDCDPRVKNIRGTSLSQSFSHFSIFDPEQRSLSYSKSNYGIGSQMLAEDGESLASGSYGQSRFEYGDLLKDDLLVKRVQESCIGLLNAKTPETGDYPVVIERRAFSSILGLIIPMLKASTVDKGLSLFGESLNEKVASGIFHIEDDPFSMKGLGVRPFDGEGSASKKTVIVGDGILNHFLSNAEFSKKMDIPNTHNASRGGNSKVSIGSSNIVMRSGTLATSAIKAMKPKLIEVKNIMGLHAGFNSVSGDFSFQAEGHLYEMGEQICALQNFVISGNIKDLLMNIEDLGAGLLDTGSSIVCPDVLISSMKVIGS